MTIIKKILVPTDLSDHSLVAMDFATALAMPSDGQIYLVHVVEIDPVLALRTVDLNSETILRDAEEGSRKEMQRFFSVKLNQRSNLTYIVRRGDAYKEIMKFARDESIDVIVMATHGRTGIAHALLGSVAEKVVRHATVPVLTVKPHIIQEKLLKDQEVEEQLHLKG